MDCRMINSIQIGKNYFLKFVKKKKFKLIHFKEYYRKFLYSEG